LQKIDSLKEQGISLTDHIAVAAQQRAERRAQLMSNLRSTKSASFSSCLRHRNM